MMGKPPGLWTSTSADPPLHEGEPDGHVHFGAPMTMPMGYRCAVHQHDSWVPIMEHHVWPLGMGGPDTEDNKIKLCANGHYAIHEYLRQLILHKDGKVPWSFGQHFSHMTRHYATVGWERAGKPTKEGKSE